VRSHSGGASDAALGNKSFDDPAVSRLFIHVTSAIGNSFSSPYFDLLVPAACP